MNTQSKYLVIVFALFVALAAFFALAPQPAQAAWGAGSCVGDNACTGATGDIGDNSCNGYRACYYATDPIGANSCVGDYACWLATGPIGANSCNASDACAQAAGPIGANACNGSSACADATGPIGDCERNLVEVPACSSPEVLLSNLVTRASDMNLQQGISNSLDAKLGAVSQAITDLNENNDVAAVNALEAFINDVEAQRGKKITNEQADALIADAQKIIDLING